MITHFLIPSPDSYLKPIFCAVVVKGYLENYPFVNFIILHPILLPLPGQHLTPQFISLKLEELDGKSTSLINLRADGIWPLEGDGTKMGKQRISREFKVSVKHTPKLQLSGLWKV